MKKILSVMMLALVTLGFAGCNSIGEVLPPNDRVLVYELPYDLTYLRTMEALDNHANWELQETDKENGTISVRDTNFSSLDDADLRVIEFLVKRVDRSTTSVSIAPGSQKVYGGADLLDAVAAALGRETRS